MLCPPPRTPEGNTVKIAVVASVLIFKVQWSVLRTLGFCAALGLAAGLAGLPIT